MELGLPRLEQRLGAVEEGSNLDTKVECTRDTLPRKAALGVGEEAERHAGDGKGLSEVRLRAIGAGPDMSEAVDGPPVGLDLLGKFGRLELVVEPNADHVDLAVPLGCGLGHKLNQAVDSAERDGRERRGKRDERDVALTSCDLTQRELGPGRRTRRR